MAAKNDTYVLTVDLKAKYLVDGFLLVQDLYNIRAWGDHREATRMNWFGNYTVHVGNDTNWENNPTCPDGPFLTRGGPENG